MYAWRRKKLAEQYFFLVGPRFLLVCLFFKIFLLVWSKYECTWKTASSVKSITYTKKKERKCVLTMSRYGCERHHVWRRQATWSICAMSGVSYFRPSSKYALYYSSFPGWNCYLRRCLPLFNKIYSTHYFYTLSFR